MMHHREPGAGAGALTQIYEMIGTLLFLGLDGHHVFLALLHGTFVRWPLGGDLLTIPMQNMIGGAALTEESQRRGLSMNLVRGGTGGAANCLRMAPPLTISDREVDLAAEILDSALLAVTEHVTP